MSLSSRQPTVTQTGEGEPLPSVPSDASSVYVATKKESLRPKRRRAFEIRQDALAWLQAQADMDPFVDEYEVNEYERTVIEDDSEGVIGHVTTVPFVDGGVDG